MSDPRSLALLELIRECDENSEEGWRALTSAIECFRTDGQSLIDHYVAVLTLTENRAPHTEFDRQAHMKVLERFRLEVENVKRRVAEIMGVPA